MKVLSNRCPGIYFVCENCGSVVVDVKDNEIYNGRDVYCPICSYKNEILFDKNYDGVAKEENK